ncbi:MAG: hypothetical protein DCC75_06835 [Proteobacteria bacterium]|nr:MAG: hypothetical protein DCC75_06835 [Pseudomonadota bacterium]
MVAEYLTEELPGLGREVETLADLELLLDQWVDRFIGDKAQGAALFRNWLRTKYPSLSFSDQEIGKLVVKKAWQWQEGRAMTEKVLRETPETREEARHAMRRVGLTPRRV